MINLPAGPKLWHMELQTFVGTSPGARHTYVKLDPGGVGPEGQDAFDDLRVEHYLSKAEVKLRNEKDGTFVWCEHHTSEGFETRQEAVDAGLCVFRTLQEPFDAICLYNVGRETLLEGPKETRHLSPHVFGYNTGHRMVDIVVKRVRKRWVYVGDMDEDRW